MSSSSNPAPGLLDRPNTGALARVADSKGAGASRPGQRAVLTSAGLVSIEVVDRFTERLLDIHWEIIAHALAGREVELLATFRDVILDGHQLAFNSKQLRSAASAEAR